MKLGEMTDTNKGMNPLHFKSDQIQINPEIWIQIQRWRQPKFEGSSALGADHRRRLFKMNAGARFE